MATELTDKQREIFHAPEFAVVGTLNPDGRPQLSVVWVTLDGDDVLFSTTVGRRKHLNLLRDPRCTVLVQPAASPYSYVEVRGTATITEEGGRELIDRFAADYMGADRYSADDGTDSVRVVVRIKPEHIASMGI